MKKHPIQYIKSFGLKLWITQILILIFNKFNIFKNLKNKLIISKNNIITKYLNKKYSHIIKKYQEYKPPKPKHSNTIWIFWWQGLKDAPEIVKSCIKSIKNNMENHKVIIITKENFNEYCDIPSYIKSKFETNQISITFLSDYLRMNLLKKYGGRWMDATIFLTDNPFNNVKENDFYTIKFHTNEKTSISKGKWCCFFIGGDNQIFYEFMTNIFNEYYKNEKLIIDYFLFDYLIQLAYNNIEEIKEKFDSVSYNNENIHKLQSLINKTFNLDEYKKLIQTNSVHKLSYKQPIKNDKNSYYNSIIKNQE